jgi:hypothetical protein
MRRTALGQSPSPPVNPRRWEHSPVLSSPQNGVRAFASESLLVKLIEVGPLTSVDVW